ncbi:MAG TPA: CDP-alcohol phosphatidyltransferase family protein, partial [Candidatus Krumholzibacteria bacterium]|nr:CDP-alcohol phosphatidyltransferase family protein [Candidatus Krumholzibacteria bacterium]
MTGLFIWTAFGLAGTLALVWMVRRGRGARDERIRVADWLTIARLALIAPTAWLLVHHHFIAAAICYTVLGTTDVIDGMIARARRETSAFGMFLDPLADILSTAAVYTLFVLDGLITRWLFALMLLRYVPLAVAALVLTRTTGPVDFSSTIPGKIVGVLQGAAALWIMAWAARGVRPIP